jgi:hypothetical protein
MAPLTQIPALGDLKLRFTNKFKSLIDPMKRGRFAPLPKLPSYFCGASLLSPDKSVNV